MPAARVIAVSSNARRRMTRNSCRRPGEGRTLQRRQTGHDPFLRPVPVARDRARRAVATETQIRPRARPAEPRSRPAASGLRDVQRTLGPEREPLRVVQSVHDLRDRRRRNAGGYRERSHSRAEHQQLSQGRSPSAAKDFNACKLSQVRRTVKDAPQNTAALLRMRCRQDDGFGSPLTIT